MRLAREATIDVTDEQMEPLVWRRPIACVASRQRRICGSFEVISTPLSRTVA